MDKINNYLKKNYEGFVTGIGEMPKVTKRLYCKDGFSISVQANEHVYCDPLENKAWPYSKVELGFPNAKDDLIADYAEDPLDYTDTVYPYVPISIVNELVEKHGSIVNEEGS